MKECSKCKKTLPSSEFNQRKSKLSSYCKVCNKEYQRQHYLQNKKQYKVKAKAYRQTYRENTHRYLMEHAKDGCVQCGEKDYRCLDFDHINPDTKSFSISDMIAREMSLEKIKQELTKCQTLCANCHRKKTADDLNWYALIV